jgi:ribosomal protein S19
MQVQRKKFFRIKTTDIGGVFYLYNGRLMFPITILESMVGFRFGEFVLTKRLGSGIHVKKTRKSKKR